MSNLEKIFAGNWDELKGKLKNQWGKLTDNDIKQVDGSIDELVGKLEKYYGYEKAKIEKDIGEFMDGNDFLSLKSKANQIKKSAMDKSQELKETVMECVSEYFEKIKNSSVNAEEKVASYCKEHPMKTAALLLVAGFAAGALLAKKE